MKKSFLIKILYGCVFCILVVGAGCYVQVGGWSMPAKFERKVQLSKPFTFGSKFEAETHNGSITVSGSSVLNCSLEATITARAGTQEEAKKLAEQIEVALHPSRNKLTVKIEKPQFMVGKSVGVDLVAIVPNQTSPELTTYNGAIRLANINGRIKGIAHNGIINTEKLTGSINLATDSGRISCMDIRGDIKIRTQNGDINVAHSKMAPGPISVSIITNNGEIDFTSPPNLSASIELIANNGSIKTDLPITVAGQLNKRTLKGIIGAGEGKLHLETHNGSIRIR